MRLLLAKGADPHATAMAGANAITAASLTGEVEAVRLLLARKVDVHAVRTRGRVTKAWPVQQRESHGAAPCRGHGRRGDGAGSDRSRRERECP